MHQLLTVCLALAAVTQPAGEPAMWKQRKNVSEEDLRKQLLVGVPDVGLKQPTAALLHGICKTASSPNAPVGLLPLDIGPRFFAWGAPAAVSIFPWRHGPDSMLGQEAAERLHVLSTTLRAKMQQATASGEVRPDAGKLRAMLTTSTDWHTPAAIPTLVQLLQAEGTPLRLLLVETLAAIDGEKASAALADRAVFDLSAEVRKEAVKALARRPSAEYEKLLLKRLFYPWPPASDHAAEAIVALRLKHLVPALIPQLNWGDPRLPYKENGAWKLQTMVQVNHLCNCLVCHAWSTSKDDQVRGLVPEPGKDPPPAYYSANNGVFVRASITFLKQDFSVVQPVPEPLKWPTHQRFDYMVSARPALPQEVQIFKDAYKAGDLPQTFDQHEAVLFTLRELTGQDLGSTYSAWATLLQPAPNQGPAPSQVPAPKQLPTPGPPLLKLPIEP